MHFSKKPFTGSDQGSNFPESMNPMDAIPQPRPCLMDKMMKMEEMNRMGKMNPMDTMDDMDVMNMQNSNNPMGAKFSNNGTTPMNLPGQMMSKSDPAMSKSDPAMRNVDPAMRSGDPVMRNGNQAMRNGNQAMRNGDQVKELQNKMLEQEGFNPLGRTPQTVSDIYFTPGFLRTQIGNKIRVDFLIGSNAPLVDRTGILEYVGASYILLAQDNSDDLVMCDLYAIKFVTILR